MSTTFSPTNYDRNLVIVEVLNQARAIQGRRKSRTLEPRNIERALDEMTEHPEFSRIRVYSSQGFVPNAYKYRVMLSYVEIMRQEDGTCKIYAAECDAKRPHSSGALVTVDGRAA